MRKSPPALTPSELQVIEIKKKIFERQSTFVTTDWFTFDEAPWFLMTSYILKELAKISMWVYIHTRYTEPWSTRIIKTSYGYQQSWVACTFKSISKLHIASNHPQKSTPCKYSKNINHTVQLVRNVINCSGNSSKFLFPIVQWVLPIFCIKMFTSCRMKCSEAFSSYNCIASISSPAATTPGEIKMLLLKYIPTWIRVVWVYFK